jgi:hypothetical protein
MFNQATSAERFAEAHGRTKRDLSPNPALN